MREKPPHYPRFRHTCSVPGSYQLNTCVASSSDFATKSEDEATQVRRRYDAGTAESLRIGVRRVDLI